MVSMETSVVSIDTFLNDVLAGAVISTNSLSTPATQKLANWRQRFGPDTRTFFRLNIKRKQQRLFKYWEKER